MNGTNLFRAGWRAPVLAAACWLASFSPGASAPWAPALPCIAQVPVRKSEKGDLRESIRESFPVALKGGALVLVGTLVIMVLLLGPLDFLRKALSRETSLTSRSEFPSGRRHYVKIGALGVPSEFTWRFPMMVVGGENFNMRAAHRIKGAKDTWELEGGTRIEFVTKAEVDAARQRHAEEVRAAQATAHAWRRFDEPEDEPPKGRL